MNLGIFASGFSPFHAGYVYAMKQAIDAGVCDGIMAAIHVDPTVERPDKRKPIETVLEREIILRAIRWVKAIRYYETEADLEEVMRVYQPSVRILGEEYKGKENTGDRLGIPCFFAKRRPGWSGTEFCKRIVDQWNQSNAS